jgi:hypothetical protein
MFNNIKTNAISSELEEYMSQYESFKSVTDYRKFIFSHYIDPATDFNKKWIQESFLNASNLFNYRKRKSTEAAFNNEDDPISLPLSFYDC